MLDWLEFEEIVGRRWHRWAVNAASYPRHPDAAVALAELRGMLGTFFRGTGGVAGLTVDSLQAVASEHRLSWRQRLGLDREYLEIARRDETKLCLPERLDCLPERPLNRDLYLWLAAHLAEARAVPEYADPLQHDLARLREARRASIAVCEAFPGLALRYRRLCEALLAVRPRRRLPAQEAAVEALVRALLSGRPPAAGFAAELHERVCARRLSLDGVRAARGYRPPLPVPLWGEVLDRPPAPERDRDATTEPGGNAAGEALEGQRHAERRRLDQTERDDPLLLNIFAKVLSWAEMINVNRHVDDDDPEEARRAAEHIDQITVSGHRKDTSTRLRMALDLAPAGVDEQPLRAPLTYPEWHYRKQRYLPDHCTVRAARADEEGEDWRPGPRTRRHIRRVRRQFEALRPRRELLRAQIDGTELDTDAVVRSHCDLRAGGSGSDNIYAEAREQSRDLAVFLLVDVSLSTEAWIEDRRVLDIEKEALLALVHGLDACGDAYAVSTFTSHRRHRVHVREVKRFDESLSARVERRIQAIRPGEYTRMGAAIRHVTGELSDRPHRHRLLLLLTDGKPNDSDHYEARFAIEDTRRAVQEARRKGLAVFGITIDQEAQQYFPYLFGRGGYAIVRRPSGLSAALPAIYRQLVSG